VATGTGWEKKLKTEITLVRKHEELLFKKAVISIGGMYKQRTRKRKVRELKDKRGGKSNRSGLQKVGDRKRDSEGQKGEPNYIQWLGNKLLEEKKKAQGVGLRGKKGPEKDGDRLLSA